MASPGSAASCRRDRLCGDGGDQKDRSLTPRRHGRVCRPAARGRRQARSRRRFARDHGPGRSPPPEWPRYRHRRDHGGSARDRPLRPAARHASGTRRRRSPQRARRSSTADPANQDSGSSASTTPVRPAASASHRNTTPGVSSSSSRSTPPNASQCQKVIVMARWCPAGRRSSRPRSRRTPRAPARRCQRASPAPPKPRSE